MKTLFIGPLGGGKIPNTGASVKNYHLVDKLKTQLPELVCIDTHNWKRNPFVIFKIISKIILKNNLRVILSLSSDSANKLIKLINKISPTAEIIYWVIGGVMAKWLKEGKYEVKDYSKIKHIFVEGYSMKVDMESLGLTNVTVIPNFKVIPDIKCSRINKDKIIKFVFLSRIIPEKGCDKILDAVKILNDQGYSNKFKVDFYGTIDTTYDTTFRNRINDLSNVSYKGFLDLRINDNYKVLQEYDIMLFPTYWKGEGCPGIIIDAYIASLPVIASDWNLNSDYVQNNYNGIILKNNDPDSLARHMLNFLERRYDLNQFKRNAKSSTDIFNIDNVLSKSFLESILN